MRHSEQRCQPRHVNPRIQVISLLNEPEGWASQSIWYENRGVLDVRSKTSSIPLLNIRKDQRHCNFLCIDHVRYSIICSSLLQKLKYYFLCFLPSY